MTFRNGQWVVFDITEDMVEIKDKLFKTPEGQGSGLFAKGGSVAHNEKGEPLGNTYDLIRPVDQNGKNIAKLEEMQVLIAELDPSKLQNLGPATRRDQIPEARIKDNPDWQPKAQDKNVTT